VFTDASRALAGLTPDDDGFVTAAFTLAFELSQPDGLCGDAEQGFLYWRLGEASLARQTWVFGAVGARFAGARAADLGAIAGARGVYKEWEGGKQGKAGAAAAIAMKDKLLVVQRSGRMKPVPLQSGDQIEARLCCSQCGRSDAAIAQSGSPNRSKLKRCARCGISAYCNAECQRLHWPKHKIECKALASAKQAREDLKKQRYGAQAAAPEAEASSLALGVD
jgi:hypothetical protein